MNSKSLATLTLMLGLTLGLVQPSFGQGGPFPPITFKGKLRDFREHPSSGPLKGNEHPDFNSFGNCSGTGAVSQKVNVNPLGDTTFPGDNRNPLLVNSVIGGKKCFTDNVPGGTATKFNQWFTDFDAETNRPFITDLVFTTADGINYTFANPVYFPLDNMPGSFGNTLPVGGSNNNHNFGFTLEFHQPFTYQKGKNQKFDFKGDDDVWVYINETLVIDLGGIHGAQPGSVDLDAMATTLGLVDGGSYMMDFFFAERHTNQSNLQITTSLVLGKKQVQPVIANPPGGTVFRSMVTVTLSTLTEEAEIRYTLDGSVPSETVGLIYNPALPIQITASQTIKAIAHRTGYTKSDLLTAAYTKEPSRSTLEILDQNGNPLTNGYLTEKNTAYTVKITTTQAGLATITDEAKTALGNDKETLTQGPAVEQAGNLIYTGTVPLSITPTAILGSGNAKSDAITYDSLTVKWINPVDPTDIAERKVQVRPAPVQATVFFSKVTDGSTTTDTYEGTETKLYVFVVDQVLPPGVTPKIILESQARLGSGRAPDKLTLDLIAIAPGKYRAEIDVDINPFFNLSDKKLQLAVEDQVTATYTDPLDGANPSIPEAPAIATAGYGIAPEIPGKLDFADKNYTVLPGGIFYSPTEGKLYLTYADDFAGGLIPTKSVTLTIANTNGNRLEKSDAETFNVTLNLARKSGNMGVWEGSITLVDGPEITANNGKAETYVLGKVTATVVSHDKSGAANIPASDNLNVAYPDKNPEIKIENPTRPGETILRGDSTLIVEIKDQSISSGIDTLYTDLSCSESGDILAIILYETAPNSGVYISKTIPKAEGSAANDGTLQCRPTDNIKLTYTDPVYGNPKPISILIDEPVVTKITYSKSPTDLAPIGSVNQSVDSTFTVVVEARDPNINVKDIITVTLTTLQGESETFQAVETGNATGKFIVQVPFTFVSNKPGVDQIVQGQIIPQSIDNRVNVKGSVVSGNNPPTTANIILIAAYNPVKKAYIKDANGDGQGDQIYVEFEKPLAYLPATLQAQWNDTASAFKTVNIGKLKYVTGTDNTVIVADYSNPQFPPNLTTPARGQSPKAVLPSDALFIGQTPVIQDSMGPVIIKAVKKPADVKALVRNDPSFYHDTLTITLSEPLKAGNDFKDMLKFAISCKDYSTAVQLDAISEPEIDAAGNYIVIVDNSKGATPLTGNCIFLNAEPGKFTDNFENAPTKHGTLLEGVDPRSVIQNLRGYPPVAGLDPSSTKFQVAVQDSRDDKNKGFSTPTVNSTTGGAEWQVLWFPPWNYTSENAPLLKHDITNLKKLELATLSATRESQSPMALPPNASTIQVVSTAPYLAHISIFDQYGNFVVSSVQVFGAHGEMQNLARVVPKGVVSYLYWDMLDKKGQKAGQGVYVWKIRFEFLKGKQEIQYIKTGIVRK